MVIDFQCWTDFHIIGVKLVSIVVFINFFSKMAHSGSMRDKDVSASTVERFLWRHTMPVRRNFT